MNSREVLVTDLPEKPPLEVALKAHNEGLDIPRVCFYCIAVMRCSGSKISAADKKTFGVNDYIGIRATDICLDFRPQE